MPYNAGDAYLRLIPVFTGISEKINAEASKWGATAWKNFSGTFNKTVETGTASADVGPSDSSTTRKATATGGRFADAFKARVAAALKDMPNVDIDADTGEADRKLAELRAQLVELSTKHVGVDIDAAEAEAKLDEIRAQLDELGARSPNVRVQVDAAAASAELAAFEAEVQAVDGSNIDIPVDTGGLNAGAAGVAGISAAIIGLIALVGPATAGLAAIGAAAASTIGALASGAGVAALGVGGIANAVNLLGQREKAMQSAVGGGTRAMGAQANQAGQLKQAETALANARAAADDAAIASAERVKSARQSLADAVKAADREQVQSAEDVQRAEENLSRAIQNSTDAQQALNDAREQAVRDLEDYANRAVDSNLSLQQSQIDLIEAQQQYQQDQADPKVTPLQLQQDLLNVAKAQQSLVEAQQEAAQAASDNADAQKKGVDGAPGVVQAEHNITTALQAQKQAQQDLADARQKAADDTTASQERIQKAQQAVSDALRQQAAQQRQSAASVQSAEDRVAQAMRGVGGAAGAMGGAGNAALARIDAQLANVNPSVLRLAEAIRQHVIPAFHDLQGAAAEGLAPGLLAGGGILAGLLPGLKTYVKKVGGILGDMFKNMAGDLAGPFWQRFFSFIDKNTGPMLKMFGQIAGNFAKGIAGFLQAMQPITDMIGNGLLDISKKFEKWATGDGVKTFVKWLEKNGPTIFTFFKNVFDLTVKIIKALTPLGLALMKAFNMFAGPTDKMPTDPSSPKAIANDVIGAMLVVKQISKQWSDTWDAMKRAWEGFSSWVSTHFDAFKKFVSDKWHEITSEPGKLWSGMWTSIRNGWTIFSAWISTKWTAFKTTSKVAWDAFVAIITNPFRTAYTWLKDHFNVVDWFHTVWTKVKTDTKNILGSIGSVAKSAFSGVVSWLKGALNNIISMIDSVISALNQISFTVPKGIPGIGGKKFGISIPLIPHLANGGVLAGYAPGVDSIFAALSPGEGILVPEAVRGLGGAQGINSINRYFAPRVPRLADGGVLGATLAAASASGGSISFRVLTATVAAMGMLGGDKSGPVVAELRGLRADVVGAAAENARVVGGAMRDAQRARERFARNHGMRLA